jgi:hypothetical protein
VQQPDQIAVGDTEGQHCTLTLVRQPGCGISHSLPQSLLVKSLVIHVPADSGRILGRFTTDEGLVPDGLHVVHLLMDIGVHQALAR